MPNRRRTKIVATLGPATDGEGELQALLAAGVDVVRINFSHGTAEDHGKRVAAVRAAAHQLAKPVAVLADLQGPKIRIGGFVEGSVHLECGQAFILDAELGDDQGDLQQVGLAYRQLVEDARPGDALLLADGAIRLRVSDVQHQKIHCEVEQGGVLASHQGLNRLGGGLSAAALTPKDHADIKTAVELGVDYLAVSFPGRAADMTEARRLLVDAGGSQHLVAKIERAEALHDLENIIRASDGVMVARGDLGVEIGEAELPGVQKRIIRLSRELNRPVITATQMMESMRFAPLPTRAEVMDVANAVLDGTDAVMLSAETATGQYPVKTVEAMARICVGAEVHRKEGRSRALLDIHFQRIDEAIAMATMYTAIHMQADAIVALTESGTTPLWMSRIGSTAPIFAMTPNITTQRRLALAWGITPILFDPGERIGQEMIDWALYTLKSEGHLNPGQRVIVTKGDRGDEGGTNAMKILEIP